MSTEEEEEDPAGWEGVHQTSAQQQPGLEILCSAQKKNHNIKQNPHNRHPQLREDFNPLKAAERQPEGDMGTTPVRLLKAQAPPHPRSLSGNGAALTAGLN